MNKKRVLQIVVPIFMVAVIAGIWFLSRGDKVVIEEGDDFALHASSVDIEALSDYGIPIIIDFGATECIPCIEMAPVLENVNADTQGKAIIKFVDVWVNANGADGYPVMTIPTQVIVEADGGPYEPSETLPIKFIMYVDPDTEEHLFTVHQGGLTEEEMYMILEDMGVSV